MKHVFSADTVIVVLASRSALIASDILILTVTWAKTYRDRKDILETGLRSSLSGILYRDGEHDQVLSFRLTYYPNRWYLGVIYFL